MDFENEIELKLKVRTNDNDLEDKIRKFQDVFIYAFGKELEIGQVETLLTIIKINGVVINEKLH